MLFGLSTGDGGETFVIDGRRIEEELASREPAFGEVLRRPVRYAANGQDEGAPIKQQPVFAAFGEDFQLRCLRLYIEQGHAAAGLDVPAELAAAMDAFDEISRERARQTEVLLGRGVALIWNNRRMLHGRRPFSETSSRRRLRRVYGAVDSGRLATTGAVR